MPTQLRPIPLVAIALCLAVTAAPLLTHAADPAQEERIRSLIADLAGEGMSEQMRAKGASAKLVKIGTPAVPHLIEALKHKDPYARLWSVSTLASIGDPRAVKPVTDCLNHDPAPLVRQIAVWHINRWIDDPGVEKAIIARVDDPSPDVREWARRSLAAKRKELFRELLRKQAQSEDPERANEALSTLRQVGDDPESKALLKELMQERLKSPRAKERTDALATLEKMLDERAYTDVLIGRVANDADIKIRVRALQTILKRVESKEKAEREKETAALAAEPAPTAPAKEKPLRSSELVRRAVPVLIVWFEKLPKDWNAATQTKARKIARLALRKLTGDPFLDKKIPEDESDAEAAKRWGKWWESRERLRKAGGE